MLFNEDKVGIRIREEEVDAANEYVATVGKISNYENMERTEDSGK